ncbi:Uncharacterized protein Fot_26753 [Forsythia ovata]|uniref:Uncharacterized protein n=1 Tax=Forsythia ovata TaxID=205694 RepID=A0ABD1UE36_9LAMI
MSNMQNLSNFQEFCIYKQLKKEARGSSWQSKAKKTALACPIKTENSYHHEEELCVNGTELKLTDAYKVEAPFFYPRMRIRKYVGNFDVSNEIFSLKEEGPNFLIFQMKKKQQQSLVALMFRTQEYSCLLQKHGFRFTEGSVDSFRPTTPGHSPGIVHSEHVN